MRDRHVARQLALKVHGILVNLRRALGLIDVVDVSADAGQQPERLPIGCSRPPGNGLSRIARGTSLSARRLDERGGPREADRSVLRRGRNSTAPRTARIRRE